MTQRLDSNAELRAAHTMRLLENAKHDVEPEAGPVGVFIRVTLAVIFMYLIVISYLMLGVTGLVFVSALSLVSYFVPHLYKKSRNLLTKRRARKEDQILGQESPQEG